MFADPDISDELMEKVVAFVEREAGRDAPLSPDDEAMVYGLLEKDPNIQRLVADLRANNRDLDSLLDDTSAVDVSDKLVALIRGHAAHDVLIARRPEATSAQTSDVNTAAPLPRSQAAVARFSYGKLALAASLALLVSCGALAYLYASYQIERLRLETRLAAASESLAAGQQALAEAAAETERLAAFAQQSTGDESEHAALQRGYDDLLAENERLNDLVIERTNAFAQADEQREQILADLSSMTATLRVGRGEEVIVRSMDQPLAGGLPSEAVSAQPLTTDMILADLNIEQQALQSRIATLETETLDLASELGVAEQKVQRSEEKAAILQANLMLAERTSAASAQRVSVLLSDLSASNSWLGQISQYHRVYTSTDREYLVEVGADQQRSIEQWFGTMLDRPIKLPDLSEHGLVFQGARLLGVNEKPVPQLIYLDANDRPLALCIIASDKEVIEPSLSADRDLNLIEWHDGRHGYALVGWSDPALLETLSETIRPVFDL